MKKILVGLFISGQLVALSKATTAQTIGESSTLIPREAAALSAGFYISSILDERAGPDSIGELFFSEDGKTVSHTITLQSASFEGLKKILVNVIPKDTLSRPLSIRIKQCDIKETLSEKDRVVGEVNLIFMFDLEKETGPVPLTQYKATARYTRLLTNLSIVEPTLRNLLGNSLKFIGDWLNTEAPGNPKLAKGIKLSFRDYLEQHDDTIYYQASRPLIWADFREKREGGKFAATVFPSFGYDQQSGLSDGVINVEIALKVFVVKSASWVGPGTRSDYNLNHEQRHFELVKLIAERFKHKILSEKLTPDNYQGIINFEYLEFYREMNKIQQKYDEETVHGTNVSAQMLWDRKIDAELRLIHSWQISQ